MIDDMDDEAFRNTISSKWTALVNRSGFSGLGSYEPLLAILVGVFCVTLILKLLPFILKGLKSWIFGIVSGLVVSWAISFFFFFGLSPLLISQQLRCALLAAVLLSLLSLALRLRAVHFSRVISKPANEAHLKTGQRQGRPGR